MINLLMINDKFICNVCVLCHVPSASSSLRHARHERLEHPHQLRENTKSQVKTVAVSGSSLMLFKLWAHFENNKSN